MVSPNVGRRSKATERIKANIRAAEPPCWLCGQPIDYSLKYPHPDAFTLEHKQSWIHHPELREDPANCTAAHARCNWAKGQGEAPASLGVLSEQW